MLCRLIFEHRQIFRQFQLQSTFNYCTHHEAIETVLLSEMRTPRDYVAKFLKKNNFLLQCNPDEMRKSFKRLKQLKFLVSDIRTHPRILLQTEYQLLNNFERLYEVGFTEVTAYRLTNVKKLMTKSVHFNQCFNFLPKNINVLQHIFATANVPLVNEIEYDQEMNLEAVHRIALRYYMQNQIKYTAPFIDVLWLDYPVLKRRSLQSIVRTVQLLEEIYQIPVRELPKHILTIQPEDLLELIQSEKMNGIDIKKALAYMPKCSLERIEDVKLTCYSYNIYDNAIKYSPQLFSLSVDTLKERADKISRLKRGKEFLRHICIGRLIMGIGRLELYTETKKIHFDAIFNDTFVDFYLNGFMNKSNTPMFYMCNEFKKTEDEIQNALQVHPHWKHYYYSYSFIQNNIEYLLSQRFTHEDIFNNLHIVLYSITEIKEFFSRLKDPDEMNKLNITPSQLTRSQILRLCVYFIERKCNFNGEGIFLNSQATKFEDDESFRFEEIIKTLKMY